MTQSVSKPSIDSRADLAEFIGDRSSEEIARGIIDLGIDDVLESAFDAIAARFVPERANGRTADVQWIIGSPFGTHPFVLRIREEGCKAETVEVEKPALTVRMDVADFMLFIAGRLDAITAFAGGRLRVRGDLTLAAGLERWFDYD